MEGQGGVLLDKDWSLGTDLGQMAEAENDKVDGEPTKGTGPATLGARWVGMEAARPGATQLELRRHTHSACHFMALGLDYSSS